MTMTSEQLRQFKVIAECKNMTKASELLYVTQPALSMALRKLEEELVCSLFLRDGRVLKITEDGKKLLHYAEIVTDAIDRATDYFRVKEYSSLIKLYNIGGVAKQLLTESCYNMGDYRLNCILVNNSELPKIVGSGIADLVIADDRYMKLVMHEHVEKKLLYRQQLILSVHNNDPLAKYDEIDVNDLQEYSMLGRSNPYGFNDWLHEIKSDNDCDFIEIISIDSITYLAERSKLHWPYFISSFGVGLVKGKDYFSTRKLIRVNGKYTERDIYLWWNKRNRKNMELLIERIIENAVIVDRQDKIISFN